MATPQEIATVTANGQSYDIWTELEATRSCIDIIDHVLLTVAEISPEKNGLISSLKLKPGDQATVALGGVNILSGIVYMRQGLVDGENHQVQIGACSGAQAVMTTTVKGEPGQYVNQTLQQIGSAAFGAAGVKFTVMADGDMPFERVSEHGGESLYSFIERLCRMRNMHMIDDGFGGIVAFRGSTPGGLVVQEGQNLKSGNIILKIDEHVDDITVNGHTANQDSADQNRAPTGHATSDPPIGRPMKLTAEEMGNSQAMQLRANHQVDWDKLQQVDGTVTVQGWFAQDGSLWWTKVTNQLTVNSPTLLPNDTYQFMIKGVTHKQSSEGGTITDIHLCRSDGFGSGLAEPIETSQ